MTDRSAASKALAGNHGFSLISDEKLLALYAAMLRCRLIEERIDTLPVEDDFPGGKNTLGLEAALAGVALDLLAGDSLLASRHNLAAGFIHGVPQQRLFAQILTGDSKTANPTAHPPVKSAFAPWQVFLQSSNTPSLLNRALDIALANKIADNGKIVAVFCDAASNGDDFWRKTSHEALGFASRHSLPILIVCLHPARKTGGPRPLATEEIAISATQCGFPGIAVDGNDVVAIYRVATESIARIRQGRGPTLIECIDWRDDKHSTENPRKSHPYRRVANDPLAKMERYLTRKGLFNEGDQLEVTNSFAKELDKALRSFNQLLIRQVKTGDSRPTLAAKTKTSARGTRPFALAVEAKPD